MEQIIISKTRKSVAILAFVLTLVVTNSCKVTFVPDYDATISAQIDNTAKEVDKFYLTMLESTKAEDNGRAFDHFSKDYIDIEVELNSLLAKNKIRPLNENSTKICQITLQLWQKYKEEHKKDNTLSDGLIKLNRMTFSDLFYAMQVAEKGKELAKNPPE